MSEFNKNLLCFIARELLDRGDPIAEFLQCAEGRWTGIDQDGKQREAEAFFLLAEIFRPLQVNLAFAIGDEDDIAFFEARLAKTLKSGVQRCLKICAAPGKIFGQIHYRLGFDFITVPRIHVEDLQWRVG